MEDKSFSGKDAVDIGGDIYFLGDQRATILGFKDRRTFDKMFGSLSSPDIDLIKKHFPFGKKFKKIDFDSEEDISKLKDIIKKTLEIRKKRTDKLKAYNGLRLSDLPEIEQYTKITNILNWLEMVKYTPKMSLIDETPPIHIKPLPSDRLIIALEFLWYLLRPADLGDKKTREQESWDVLIQHFVNPTDTDVMTMVNNVRSELDRKSKIESSRNAFNALKRLEIDQFLKTGTVSDALKAAKGMILKKIETLDEKKTGDKIKNIIAILTSMNSNTSEHSDVLNSQTISKLKTIFAKTLSDENKVQELVNILKNNTKK